MTYDAFDAANDAWDKGDLRRALKLFSEGSALGDPYCQNSLGVFLECGLGCRRNAPEAISWYRRAYRHGALSEAALNLATLYSKLEKNSLARGWFQRAVDLGDGDAALEFAKHILRIGTPAKSRLLRVEQLLEQCLSLDATPDSAGEAQALLTYFRRTGSFPIPQGGEVWRETIASGRRGA